MARSHEHAGFVLRRVHQVGREGLDADVQTPLRAVELLVGLNRDHDVLVLRLAKGRAEFLADAHHLKSFAINVESFAQRVGGFKQPFGDIRADHGDVGAV